MYRPELIHTRFSQAVDEAEDAAVSPSSLGAASWQLLQDLLSARVQARRSHRGEM